MDPDPTQEANTINQKHEKTMAQRNKKSSHQSGNDAQKYTQTNK